jgi:hypothetical protein
MIKTLSDFLEELKTKGTELIKKYEIIDHPVLIGDMYEGLTQELLNRAIFDGLNLKIVGGKIKNSKGELSGEIDCMLVEGKGEKLPFTEKYIFHFSQVIAVIEVKKSLYSNTLGDSYSNLKTVIDISREPEKDGDDYIMHSLRDSWKSLLRIELPRRSELNSYSETEQHIYHTLLMEAYFPLRIVFGYFGFKTEYSLREAFANYLGDKANFKPAKGFGAGSLPSLIICGKNAIIKNNGMPYAMPFSKEEYYWPIYVTSRENPIRHLIEFIWTRLSYKFEISSSIFGPDFDYEPVHKYINCKVGKDDEGNPGWMYNYSPFSEKILSETKKETIPWTPVFPNKKQFIAIIQIFQHEFINYVDNSEFIESITEDGTDLREFISTLVDTGLVYDRNNEIRLLTDECQTLILPDGRYCVGENKNGELTHWLDNYMKDKNASR